ncbi:4Fe-4S binding protein [Paenibacillus sp. NFR01]|uniref:4Fe-4S binding protein n=1 Tax=Paenibacillus sp. NFR01 TaxID=1566279 RepID=UPI0008BDF4A6|nr:4Fe-4S binding protein [Paenibacillus sp. NFR01]SET02469.1 4Fe-4S binding domain-containing protein [Paenibacillus sp. NFR01]
MKRQKVRQLLLLLSFLLFPVTLFYFSPYLIIQGGAAGIVTGSFIVFAALFGTSLVFGRAFCGWLCPGGGLQESCRLVADKKIKRKGIRWIKYFLWAPWIAGIIGAFAAAGGFHAVDFFYMTEHGISAGSLPGLATYFAIVALIATLALTIGRRGMCYSICWMSPFMVFGTLISDKLRLPTLHLQPVPANCTSCGRCTRQCPMSIEVTAMVNRNDMRNPECILCGGCADVCPSSAIHLTFGKKENPRRASKTA